jgi:hypothetical protein
MREREEKNPNLLALQIWEWRREVRRKGAAAPKYPQLALLTVGALRSKLNRNIRVRQEKYSGKLLWLHAHQLEYLGRAGKISSRTRPVWARPTTHFSNFLTLLRC